MKKEMTKGMKLLIGFLTILPIISIGLFIIYMVSFFGDPFKNNPPNLKLVMAFYVFEIILCFGLIVFYIINVAKSVKLSNDKRTIWIVVIVFAQFIGCSIYWYLYIWKESEIKNISLSTDEAIVFYEFLKKINKIPNNELLNDPSEQKLMYLLEGRLSEELSEVYITNYNEMLKESRKKI